MLLNERYRVIQTLGSGGFGETFLAEDTQMPSGRRCVIKQLKPIQNNPHIYQLVQERFQREAAILEDLGGSSEQIPALYAYFQLNGQFYLVQEWIEGDTLTAKVKQQGLFSESTVQEILASLLSVLEYIHSKRIVHRDIKPDNIILRDRDRQPVLIDFGAVRESMGTVLNSQGSPTSSIVIGTPGYMPSEQAAGRPVYSSDLYSLGVTAIYLLTGRQPQELETDSRTGEIIWHNYAVNVIPKLTAVIDRAIQYHPRDRFASAGEMLDALQSNVNSIPPTQPAFTQPSMQPPPSPATVNLNTVPTVQSNGRNSILMASAIASGLIGASAIISFGLTKFSQPVAQQKVPSTVKSPIETPNLTPTLTSTPASTISKLPDSTTTANDYAWLSQRLVTDADLDVKDGFELDIMRNSIFARYGRRFDTPGLQKYFDSQPWYRPIYSAKKFPSNLLSQIERQNVEYISKYQDRYNRRYFKK
ncbi:protein kinase domain-containing protein [Fischerella sp. PCC 9605]|uniref:protein kinase domain-containing protein n=1 Tax=Fischerella sp. PCC 9605 TaxID=1173024 RepID=UPI00047E473D|nr:YARHG domain-containing protein [Fischerella sp. PCC 9605]